MGQTITSPGKRATYDDLLAVPEHLVAEILFGQLVTHPRPAPRHAAATSALGSVLGPAFQFGSGGPGGWIFMVEPELHLGEHVAVPDLAAWRRERLPILPETAWIETPPDWVCEVLSPSTERYDRGDKRTIYAEAGVGHLWHIDPILQMLEVFELREGKWLLLDVFHDDAQVAAPPFADLTFAFGLLWPFEAPGSAAAMTQRAGKTVSLSGACHCGAIRATLHATRPAAELEARACQCGFCIRHGAITVSDPAGHSTFDIDRAALNGYQFETRTGTSLLCARCGMYAGAILEDGGKMWSIINVRGLAVPEFKDRVGDRVRYEGETGSQRIARRKQKWTPTEIVWR